MTPIIVPAPSPSIKKDVGDRITYLTDSANTGMNATWTVSLWYKCLTTSDWAGNTRRLFHCGAADGSLANATSIQVGDFFGTPMIFVTLWNTAGAVFKNYWYADLFSPIGNWHNIIVVWNGSGLLLFKNAALVVPTATPTNTGGSQETGSKSIGIGNSALTSSLDGDSLSGIYNSCAIWGTSLNIGFTIPQSIYSGGYGYKYDYNLPHGDYVYQADLRHYWRFGRDPSNIGRDWCSNGTVPSFDLTVSGISTQDIWNDTPT